MTPKCVPFAGPRVQSNTSFWGAGLGVGCPWELGWMQADSGFMDDHLAVVPKHEEIERGGGGDIEEEEKGQR